MMKTVYIPKGKSVRYECLEAEHLVVNGSLKVARAIRVRHISGKGSIEAKHVSADTICIHDLDAVDVICEKLIAKRVWTSGLTVSQNAVVSCSLTANYVKAAKLTVALSDVADMLAKEVINLPVKKRGMLGTLLVSALRSLWLSLTVRAERSIPVDAEYTQVNEETEAVPPDAERRTPEQPDDFELQRLIAQFKLARESGYTLRLIPGTPEENAPVFEYKKQESVPPAA